MKFQLKHRFPKAACDLGLHYFLSRINSIVVKGLIPDSLCILSEVSFTRTKQRMKKQIGTVNVFVITETSLYR